MPELTPTILESIARGDSAAVRRCIDEYGGLIWSIANRYLRGYGEDLEDAVQDVFVELWRKADRFDRAQGSEPTFVATIAHRRLIDRQRRAASRRKFEHAYAGNPSATADASPRSAATVEVAPGARQEALDENTAVGRAVGRLSEDEREVLVLSLGHGLTHERIAESTNLPLGTVKTRLRRALIRLREELDLQQGNPRTPALAKGGSE